MKWTLIDDHLKNDQIKNCHWFHRICVDTILCHVLSSPTVPKAASVNRMTIVEGMKNVASHVSMEVHS